MRKLKLEVDALEVESFAPAAGAREERGTVHAREPTYFCESWEMDCTANVNWYTCGVSCVNMCYHTREVPGCGIDTDFGCI